MKSIVIPTILTATILIAGFFAFIPVQQAQTVHTTIQSTVGTQFRVVQAGALGAAGGVSTYTLTCASQCVVNNISAFATAGDAVDVTAIVNVSYAGTSISVANVAAPADDALGDLTTAAGAGSAQDALRSLGARVAAGALNITPLGVSVAAAGTVIVSVNNSTDADADAAVTVTFDGVIASGTAPTAAFAV